MTPRQLQAHLQEKALAAKRKEEQGPLSGFLNCAKQFWDIHGMRFGAHRRELLMQLFSDYPDARLPVNNKWQANVARDPDLTVLLKQGKLNAIRGGGRGFGRSDKKFSNKRQTYLVLPGFQV